MTVTQITPGIALIGTTQEDTIKDLLDRLATLKAEEEKLADEKEKAITALIPADIKAKVAGKKRSYNKKLDNVSKDINMTTKTIKAMTLTHGDSIKGNALHAVMVKGRVSWDSSKVEGYLIASDQSPDDFRKVGKPSVSLRKVK